MTGTLALAAGRLELEGHLDVELAFDEGAAAVCKGELQLPDGDGGEADRPDLTLESVRDPQVSATGLSEFGHAVE